MVLRRAQSRYPSDFWINRRLGVDLIWQQVPNDVRNGMGYIRAAIAIRPEDSSAVMNLGTGYFFLGEHDQAILCFRKAIEISPDRFGAYGWLGEALNQQGKYEDALAALEQAIDVFELAIKQQPDLVTDTYSELSLILSTCPNERLRNPRRAAELAEKAVELEPQVSNSWTALGIARFRESRWDDAHAALDKSMQLGSSDLHGGSRWADAIDWFFLAMSNWQLGQHAEGRQCYNRAVEWIEEHPNDDEQLRGIRAEAEELLKITGEIPTTKRPVEVK